ncbi:MULTISPECIES: zf-HC2 domain-containing protein [unclassified Leifsonia]|uniref:zf-HC2 domain-containing protein n=1 Tax=unclassified Leifsonia TaxID=2663824 RepID=UPI0006F755F3|nr:MULTISPECIES: zf-HC2 domain-containing protein [unclassified Leifsonia]KQX07132.1 hypothetical protein ASC59_04850 [Leifsonia sp. Root1293]KRA11415.1 hypothetical protein ASD61_04850 [Leifsonia sp. Root60]
MSATIDAFSDWDAAYVLGALSTRERLEYEAHLATCPRCSAAVAEVAGMPGLLSKVSMEEIPDAGGAEAAEAARAVPEPVGGAPEPSGVAPAQPPTQTPTPQRDVISPSPRGRRRGRRFVMVAALAAVAATVALVLSLGGVGSPPAVRAETLHLDSTGQTALSADVRVVGKSWGTAFSTHCQYTDVAGDAENGGDGTAGDRYGKPGSTAGTGGSAASDRYGLYVTDDAGDARLVSSWTAKPGTDIRADGSTDLPIDRISMVDIRALDSDDVLLQADLDR